jgi:hypothetical protein
MLAYKLLCAGGIGPFSRYAWPLPRDGSPGAWVMAPADAVPCATAVHGCRVADLPWWLQDEMWEAEFDGPVATSRHKIQAPRARLLRRVEGWDAACAQRFADACALRARDLAAGALDAAGDHASAMELRDASVMRDVRSAAGRLEPPEDTRQAVAMAGDAAANAIAGEAVVAAYIAAQAAGRLGGATASGDERAWQSEWLRAELGLRGDQPAP